MNLKYIRAILVIFLAFICLWIVYNAAYPNQNYPDQDPRKRPDTTNRNNPNENNNNSSNTKQNGTPKKTFNLKGTVRQAPDLSPVNNALVEVTCENFNITNYTNGSGEFAVFNIPFSKIAVVANLQDGNSSQGVWLEPKSNDETIDIILPCGAVLQVYVTNEQNTPVTEASVSLTNVFFFRRVYQKSNAVKQRLVKKTNNLGIAEFKNIRLSKLENKLEEYWLVASHPQYHNEFKYPIDVKNGVNYVTVVLKKDAQPSTIIGRLAAKGETFLANRPVSHIIETPDGKHFSASTKTDQSGTFFTIQGKTDIVKNGAYQTRIFIKVWIEGYKPFEKLVTSELRVGEHVDIGIIELSQGNRINGYVYDEKGNPIKDAIVAIEKAGQIRTERSLRLKTNELGYFETNSIGDDLYDIFVESKEYPAGSVNLNNCLLKNVQPNTLNIQFRLVK